MTRKFSNQTKCFACLRFVPAHLRKIFCSSCNKYYHSKCIGITTAQYLAYNSWKCQHCLEKVLPFFSASDDTLKLTLTALPEPSQLHLQLLLPQLLPHFTARSLIDSIDSKLNGGTYAK